MPKAWIDTPRGGSDVSRATRADDVDAPRTTRSTVANGLVGGVNRRPRRDGEDAGLAAAASRRRTRHLRSAPAMPGEGRQADRHVDRDNRVLGQSREDIR